jgi:hypothetical protein
MIKICPLSSEDFLKMIDPSSGSSWPYFTVDQFLYAFGIQDNVSDKKLSIDGVSKQIMESGK